jgi:hypothetical protein
MIRDPPAEALMACPVPHDPPTKSPELREFWAIKREGFNWETNRNIRNREPFLKLSEKVDLNESENLKKVYISFMNNLD